MDYFTYLNKLLESAVKKIKSFKTDEGRFSVYDVDADHPRADMFTVFESKGGWIVRNALVPDDMQKQGIATDFYVWMNQESLNKTKKPLRSTLPRRLATGEEVHELSNDGQRLWDSLVRKGLATKIGEKLYVMKG